MISLHNFTEMNFIWKRIHWILPRAFFYFVETESLPIFNNKYLFLICTTKTRQCLQTRMEIGRKKKNWLKKFLAHFSLFSAGIFSRLLVIKPKFFVILRKTVFLMVVIIHLWLVCILTFEKLTVFNRFRNQKSQLRTKL